MSNEGRREAPLAMWLGILAGLCTAASGIRRLLAAPLWTAGAVIDLMLVVVSVLGIAIVSVLLYRQWKWSSLEGTGRVRK